MNHEFESRSLLSAATLIALAVVPACWGGEAGAETAPAPGDAAPEAEPIAVAVAPVVREDIVSPYSTSATLRAEKRATVTSRTRGVLEELLVEEGDAVRAGELLALLEDDEQSLSVDRYQTTQEIKQREYERSRSLAEDAIISTNEVELLRREVEEIKHDLALARLNLRRTKITAPFDGLVVLRHLDLGATVSDGTPIYDLADLDPLYVDVNVPERHVGRLVPGQKVRLYCDAACGLDGAIDGAVGASIERIAPVVDPASGTVKVTVAVERSEAGAPLAMRPGAFVQVDIVTETHRQALVVPRSALVADGRRWLVFRVAEGDRSVGAIEVELGFEEGQRVEIAKVLGGGRLDVGDRVVVLGASALSEGAPISIHDLDRGEASGEQQPEIARAERRE